MDEPRPDAQSYPRPAYAWYVVGVLTLVYMFSYMDRQILNFMVRPIRTHLDITDTQMSYLMGFAFAVFYTLFGLPIGRIADTRNRCFLIGAGLFIWTFMTGACGLAQHYWQLLLLRVGVGIGEATLGPSAYSLIADYFPKHRRATALSVYSMGIYLGSGLAFLCGGLVVGFAVTKAQFDLPLVGAVQPWQMVFLLVGAAGLVPLLLLFTLREPERRGVARQAAVVPFGAVLRYMGRNWQTILCHHLAFALMAVFNFGLGAWLFEFMSRTHGWTPKNIGLLFGLNVMIAGALGIVAGGWLADRLAARGVRDANLRIGLIAAIAFFPTNGLFPLMEDDVLTYLLTIPGSFFLALPGGAAAAAVQEIMPNPMRGQASAMYLFVINLVGMGLGPTAVAWITDGWFGDEKMLRYSLVIVGVTVHVLALAFLMLGLKPYRRSLEMAEEWSARQG